MFCELGNTNMFYNTYTLMDIEEAKKQVYLELLRKYNYQHKDAIQNFINQSCTMLSSDLFSKLFCKVELMSQHLECKSHLMH